MTLSAKLNTQSNEIQLELGQEADGRDPRGQAWPLGGQMQPDDQMPWVRSRRLWGLLAVVAVMAVLVGGWTLVNDSISGNVPLSAGEILSVSPGGAQTALITVGPGWWQQSTTNGCVLSRAGTSLTIFSVSLVGHPSAAQAWSGLGRIALVEDPNAQLGAAHRVRGGQHAEGLIGGLALPGRPAIAALFLVPGGGFAIEMIATGKPGSSPAGLRQARQMIRSVRFPGVAR